MCIRDRGVIFFRKNRVFTDTSLKNFKLYDGDRRGDSDSKKLFKKSIGLDLNDVRSFVISEYIVTENVDYKWNSLSDMCKSNQIKSTVDLVRLLQLERRRITLSR